MAAQATAAMRRTFGGMLVAAICAGGLLAGATGTLPAHAAGPAGSQHARIQYHRIDRPERRVGQRTPDPTMGPWRVGPIPISHLGIVPDPISYPNHSTLKRMQPVACSSGCSRVVGAYIGETEKMARAALERLCLSQPARAAWFTPAFLAQTPLQQVNGLIAQYVQALGPCRDVTAQPNQTYYVQFQRGLIRVDSLQLDALGRIAGIDAGDPKLSTDRVLFEGHRVYFRCLGAGAPTVILEAGLDAPSDTWDRVIPAIARTTRVCSYDRPGTGGSDSRPGPRTSLTIVTQLHALLAQEGVPGPYVLVGHSIAGFHLRVFATRYPKDVAGMVCVDCSHPDMAARFLASLGPARPGEPPAVTQMRRQVVDYRNAEFFDVPASAAQVRASGPLGSIPLIVLTAGTHQFPAAVADREEATWRGMQEELAGLSSDSVHVLIPRSGHGIQEDAPRPVIFAVREAVGAVRAHGRLPTCSGTFPAQGGVCFPAL